MKASAETVSTPTSSLGITVSCSTAETHCSFTSLVCGTLYDMNVRSVAAHCNSSEGAQSTVIDRYVFLCLPLHEIDLHTETYKADKHI